ncbi:MarR family winged helix-turn-helix transcriptional regulator [Streptomyces sp. NPDC002536]
MTTQQLPPAGTVPREDNLLLSTLLNFAQSHQERLADQAAVLGLTVPQARVLYFVASAPTVRKLAVKLRCDASYVTGLVDRLEEQKLMKRQVDPADRRVKMLTLTAAGRRLRGKVVRIMDEAPGLELLTEKEKLLLGELLKKASAN